MCTTVNNCQSNYHEVWIIKKGHQTVKCRFSITRPEFNKSKNIALHCFSWFVEKWKGTIKRPQRWSHFVMNTFCTNYIQGIWPTSVQIGCPYKYCMSVKTAFHIFIFNWLLLDFSAPLNYTLFGPLYLYLHGSCSCHWISWFRTQS